MAKPADLVYDPNGPLPAFGAGFSLPVRFMCYEVDREPGFNVLFADGAGGDQFVQQTRSGKTP
jgi:hypothetical protein